MRNIHPLTFYFRLIMVRVGAKLRCSVLELGLGLGLGLVR